MARTDGPVGLGQTSDTGPEGSPFQAARGGPGQTDPASGLCAATDATPAQALFSIIRDPFTRLVSAYEYRGWAKAPPAPLERILERHPSFPDLDIEEFVEMNHHFTPEYLLGDIRPAVDLGPATLGFIRFFAREPRKFLEELRPGMRMDLNDGRYFPKIRFLHTEHLNQELHDTLLELGYPEDRLAFILAKPPMNTTRKKEDEYLTPALKARILDKERLLFEAFPEYMP
ncbi:MAG: hypothetical protein IPF78_06995 [Flavobacteriales bacterium]|nr:hypothetical protein [Flavobacteriales bacterium]